MDYFAGLDVSMEETHVCVVDRDGLVIQEAKVPSTPADIKAALARAPDKLCSKPGEWPQCFIMV